MNATPQSGKGFRSWYKRQSRIGRISFILTVAIIFMLLLGHVWHFAELLFIGPIIVCFIVLSPLVIILLYRWTTRRLLWKVRNRLIVTYALMSLAPVVLCLTLFCIASYIFGGQFATNSALTLLDQASQEVSEETASVAIIPAAGNAHSVEVRPIPRPGNAAPISLALVKSGIPQSLTEYSPDAPTNPFIGQPVPSWLYSGFRGLVTYNGQLYLIAYINLTQAGHTVTVLGTEPFNTDALGSIAADLGRIIFIPGFSGHDNNKFSVNETSSDSGDTDGDVNVVVTTPKGKETLDRAIEDAQKNDGSGNNFQRLDAGTLPPPTHLFDVPVVFSAPTSVLAWKDGHDFRGIITVFSRPSILYTRLFASTNGLGTFIKIVLVSIAIFFALLELFALLMAAGLSRTITRSVRELYLGTREIDRGNFAHRIVIKRKDQLGALATSFNGMTASIVDLMAQQREKERLLSELSIAREVQANLFPHSPVALPGFEIHAVCQPARTVSGDYFDFIFGRHGNELCLALGDISGKGISAALLMASLHSAVRAFGLSNSDGGSSNGTAQPSPALLLELLNKHIFASTPPEKYATLFLAYYDAVTRRLIYSNAGHLAPMVLCADGTVKHLDCGGPPVGLLDNIKYEEDTVQLTSGDLLMAFSDGLTEPEQNDEQFGEDRLLSYVREHHAESLPTLAAQTLRHLKEWIGNHEQPDDMTILLARQL
ncbi:MAG TPA: SpoIIE family protein phosphatase [Candidatus Aquilonibacter sp.]|nr:SpoIIE family protein phosphatase [Candidatus Aquilonibacter sp.]